MRALYRQAAAGLLALAAHAPGAAQVSGSVALVSDYLYRGVTFSQGKPAPQLTLVYDNPDGWYLAGFVSRFQLQYDRASLAQYVAYAGYAQRLASGTTWEAGVASYAMPAASGLNYQEVYAGLASERVSAKLSYCPDYLGLGMRTLYAETAASAPLGETLNLFAHAGYYRSLGDSWGNAPLRRADARAGVGLSVHDWQLQLAWAGVHQWRSDTQPYAARPRRPDSVVLNIARRF